MEYSSLEEFYHLFLKHPTISKDTRKITKGCIYVALKGESFDGNQFAEQAIERGAAYALIDHPEYKKDDRYLLVENTLQFLQQLANHHRRQFTIPIIAISGSNGKTTTKELIASVLTKKHKVLFTQGNYNNHIGVPLTLLGLRIDHDIAVIEMGANHQKEIEFLCTIAEPNYGMLTNIGKAHLEGFGGIEGVKKGKSELYRHLEATNGVVFLNGDDEVLSSLSKSPQPITYGKQNKNQCIGILDQTHPQLKGSWSYNDEQEGKITPQLYGEYNFYNILAAICMGNYFDVPAKLIDEAITGYESTMNRSQIIEKKGFKILLDAYNANPTSTSLALQNFDKHNSDNKVAILGDMFELGDSSKEEHLRIIELCSNSNTIEKFIFVGHHYFEHRSSFINFLFFKTTEGAKKWFSDYKKDGQTFLLKGSRGMAMEKIIED